MDSYEFLTLITSLCLSCPPMRWELVCRFRVAIHQSVSWQYRPKHRKDFEANPSIISIPRKWIWIDLRWDVRLSVFFFCVKIATFMIFWENLVHRRALAQDRMLLKMIEVVPIFPPLPAFWKTHIWLTPLSEMY